MMFALGLVDRMVYSQVLRWASVTAHNYPRLPQGNIAVWVASKAGIQQLMVLEPGN